MQTHPGSISELIARRHISHLLHFTCLENLATILEFGLLSRDELDQRRIDYCINDHYRFDGRTDTVSLSVSFPNYRMFYRLQQQNPQRSWVILLINPAVLSLSNCLYLPGNAASRQHALQQNAHGPEAFERMFADPALRARNHLPDFYPTNPEAEIMLERHIPTRCIRAIQVSNLADYALIERHLVSPIPLRYDRNHFAPRKDWAYWQKAA
jgi:hypothetical protein